MTPATTLGEEALARDETALRETLAGLSLVVAIGVMLASTLAIGGLAFLMLAQILPFALLARKLRQRCYGVMRFVLAFAVTLACQAILVFFVIETRSIVAVVST